MKQETKDAWRAVNAIIGAIAVAATVALVLASVSKSEQAETAMGTSQSIVCWDGRGREIFNYTGGGTIFATRDGLELRVGNMLVRTTPGVGCIYAQERQ